MNNVVLIIIAIATTFVIDKVFDDVLSPAAKFIVTLLTILLFVFVYVFGQYAAGSATAELHKFVEQLDTEQHIQKIVETYRDRKEIEKYSHLASLQEIAENDYNLNIPRYVDTFEEEEPIDIKAVMAEIKELEAKRAELDKEIEVYLKELGLVE